MTSGEIAFDKHSSIQIENPEHREQGVAWVELDGQRLENHVIRLGRELVKHRVLVRMG